MGLGSLGGVGSAPPDYSLEAFCGTSLHSIHTCTCVGHDPVCCHSNVNIALEWYSPFSLCLVSLRVTHCVEGCRVTLLNSMV